MKIDPIIFFHCRHCFYSTRGPTGSLPSVMLWGKSGVQASSTNSTKDVRSNVISIITYEGVVKFILLYFAVNATYSNVFIINKYHHRVSLKGRP